MSELAAAGLAKHRQGKLAALDVQTKELAELKRQRLQKGYSQNRKGIANIVSRVPQTRPLRDTMLALPTVVIGSRPTAGLANPQVSFEQDTVFVMSSQYGALAEHRKNKKKGVLPVPRYAKIDFNIPGSRLDLAKHKLVDKKGPLDWTSDNQRIHEWMRATFESAALTTKTRFCRKALMFEWNTSPLVDACPLDWNAFLVLFKECGFTYKTDLSCKRMCKSSKRCKGVFFAHKKEE